MLFKKRLMIAGLMAVMLIALFPVPVFAISVTYVTPDAIVNNVATIITVVGIDFDSSSKIFLDGVELPGTVFISATELQVTVPAGVSVGTHIVTVSLADGSDALSVSAPAPVSNFERPQMSVNSSGANTTAIKSLKEFTFSVNFQNAGTVPALNTQVTFTSADLVPTNTGGVVILGTMGANSNKTAEQTFISSTYLYGKSIVSIDATVSYYDDQGTAYSDKFTLSVPVSGASSGSDTGGATATPTGVRSGQLIIPSYGTTVDPLQPGTQFTLTMTVQNSGNDKAQRVTMIVGGGSSGSSGETPQPGGVSGGNGEFTNFAPVGTSNIASGQTGPDRQCFDQSRCLSHEDHVFVSKQQRRSRQR
jgi:hypothetical protein